MLACVVAAAGVFALGGQASAATTIGSNLADAPTLSLGCGPTCTLTSPTLVAGSRAAGGTASPSDGVVVRWRVRAGGTAGPTKLRVLRPGVGNERTGVGTGPVENPAINAVSTFNVRLPIKAGDNVGIDIDTSGPNYFNHAVAGNARLAWQPALADGATAAPFLDQNPREVLINADVEADADNDGYGDESQDDCPTDASTQGACPIIGGLGAISFPAENCANGSDDDLDGQVDTADSDCPRPTATGTGTASGGSESLPGVGLPPAPTNTSGARTAFRASLLASTVGTKCLAGACLAPGASQARAAAARRLGLPGRRSPAATADVHAAATCA